MISEEELERRFADLRAVVRKTTQEGYLNSQFYEGIAEVSRNIKDPSKKALAIEGYIDDFLIAHPNLPPALLSAIKEYKKFLKSPNG